MSETIIIPLFGTFPTASSVTVLQMVKTKLIFHPSPWPVLGRGQYGDVRTMNYYDRLEQNNIERVETWAWAIVIGIDLLLACAAIKYFLR